MDISNGSERKFKVVIVGGGSSGWMTASFLGKAFGRKVDISLVESPDIHSIGVGEATFSYIHLFFEFLGLREEDWMPECHAGYKLAIRFENWNRERRHFYHPFQKFDLVQGWSTIEWWLKLRDQLGAPFDYACFSIPAICDAQRSPRYFNGYSFDRKVDGYINGSETNNESLFVDDLRIQYPYAYHFDASLLARYLTGYAQKQGVRQVLDDVVDVRLGEDGRILSIVTKDHGEIEGDLFIDCTGFRGLLINRALKEPFISFNESLPCDSAIAMQVSGDHADHIMEPYTTATALSSGWVWKIPLYHRTGTGYVYSSAFTSPEAAEQEFRNHLGKKADGCRASHIKMRVGRSARSWVKNCVAIGLASGFVEPLESTGIFFIHHGIEQLVNYFPRHGYDEASVKSYNKAVADCIDGVREFLTMHYVIGTRDDTDFWKATKHDLVVPDGLKERLQLWKERLPTDRTINPNFHGFTAYSYSSMLIGLGAAPKRGLAILDHLPTAQVFAAFDELRRRSENLVKTLPHVYDYLSTRYGGTKAPYRGSDPIEKAGLPPATLPPLYSNGNSNGLCVLQPK
ncbi:MAG TPA: tryptophan halogenase family protein [Candidatus Angelobacter sp.]|nr:tryptophan halogenase family protein [Candidatus Angelobacter sp.]